MFKLNKATHILILMTFTIVFVVVYMYYMIRDVKKIYTEVKTHSAEIASLKSLGNDIQEVKAVISGMMASGPPMVAEAMFMQQFLPSAASAPAPISTTVVSSSPACDNDDVDSVATEDIKKLVDDDDEPDVKEEPTQIPPAVTEESLKKMKLDEIKEVCKSLNISTKGSRDTLIASVMKTLNQADTA